MSVKQFPEGMEAERLLMPWRKLGNYFEPIKSSTRIQKSAEHEK
jgi:hypothetical protein